ncbi:MAG: hypothetical protein M1269_04315 [Chloroflexi bacterium]|nr:hypothetical protein [Chloroflexota bacterium]
MDEKKCCCRCVYHFSAYFDGEMKTGASTMFECRLEGCPRCRNLFSSFALTIKLYKKIPCASLPCEAQKILCDKLSVHCREKEKGKSENK